MKLLQIVYISEAAQPFTQQQLTELVAHAHRSNAKQSITGALYYGSGHFIQTLEGADDAVIKVYAKILQDPRHKNVHLVVVRPIEDRVFPEWGMGLIENVKSEIDVTAMLKVDQKRVGGWNHASWKHILNSFRGHIRG